MGLINPCIQCGACCAFFRVSFFWEETTTATPDGVPNELTEEVDEFIQCMQGTNHPSPRCIALQGKIGEKVGCSIYQNRSTTCRDFGLHCEENHLFIDNENLTRCNEARKAWNLPPLTRAQIRFLQNYQPVRQPPAFKHKGYPKKIIKRITHF